MARLRTGKIARHQRVPRDRPLYFNEWEIPAGVSIHKDNIPVFLEAIITATWRSQHIIHSYLDGFH